MKNLFVAGSDPELMLVNTQGELVSAIGVVPGTKRRPRKVDGGAIQRDNVLCEINTDPATSARELITSISNVLQQAAKVVAPLRLVPQASANYPDKALRRREAKVFGCDPDYNAWPNEHGMLCLNIVPGDAAILPFRTAGGHFHIGYTPKSRELLENDYGKIAVVQMMDVFCGLFGVVVDDDPSSPARRKLYGKAGAHRPKPYGIEYRALGNFWIRSPRLVQAIYTLAEVAVQSALKGEQTKVSVLAGGPRKIQKMINESQVDDAREALLGPLADLLPRKIKDILEQEEPMQHLAPRDFYRTWRLVNVPI